MDPTPVVIPVSELRRDIAQVIEKAHGSPGPVFVTQRGYVTAVLLTPQKYEDLRDAGRRRQHSGSGRRELVDWRLLSAEYGPDDWETARLLDDEGVDG